MSDLLTKSSKERIKEANQNATNTSKMAIKVIAGVVALVLVSSTFYTIEEGHIGVVKTFGEAKEQVNPGLHFKIPFVHQVEEIEVRTRKTLEKLPAASKEQMPLTVEVSLNWTVNKAQALDLFKAYGGLAQFEDRIINPRLRSASKDAMAKYTTEHLVVNRSRAINDIESMLLEEMADFPVSIDSLQIENIVLPVKYLQSIEAKQTAKNLADAENHKLEQQRLQAQQLVNTAQAQRDAQKAQADGIAYKIKTEAEAEAAAIELKGNAEAIAMTVKARAIARSSTLVEYEKAMKWNGQMPTTVMGNGVDVLWNVKSQ
ncbi:prohibitin family protein [Paraferrimonas sp. SM1919]|uniref:prohibitin family protein n=1 Tax=Paraferrimonas sp. SM1919 TaxID=2662263 RepID=UPI0013D385AD|nr:prohibitin family protein [Paraferrimonas sp. SM1919]